MLENPIEIQFRISSEDERVSEITPIFLGFIVIYGKLEIGFVLPFLILDPVLALIGLYLWKKESNN